MKVGVIVDLYHSNGSLVQSTMTTAEGTYAFEDVLAGEYYILYNLSSDYIFSTADVTGANGAGSTNNFIKISYLANSLGGVPESGQARTSFIKDLNNVLTSLECNCPSTIRGACPECQYTGYCTDTDYIYETIKYWIPFTKTINSLNIDNHYFFFDLQTSFDNRSYSWCAITNTIDKLQRNYGIRTDSCCYICRFMNYQKIV
jgi:hypothetical protein